MQSPIILHDQWLCTHVLPSLAIRHMLHVVIDFLVAVVSLAVIFIVVLVIACLQGVLAVLGA